MEGLVVGLVLSEESLTDKLHKLTIDVGGGGDAAVTVVTNAPNAQEGRRVVVATPGATVNVKGEEITVKKASVGGCVSEGMLCDSPMLGWTGGAAGVAALVPDTFAPGDAPPSTRPRMDGGGAGASKPAEEESLIPKKLTKEQKKEQLRLRKEAREAKKQAKAAAEAAAAATEESGDAGAGAGATAADAAVEPESAGADAGADAEEATE